MPQRLLLLIDDNKAWLTIFGKYLEHFKYKIVTAETCAEGLVMARRHRPACILLDFHLPDADGCDLAVKLKEDPELRKTPVIMVSSDETLEPLAYTDYLMDGFFLKIWPFARAHGLVQSLLRRVNWERGTMIRDDLRLDGTTLEVLKNSKHAAYLSREQFSCLSLLMEKAPAFVGEDEIIAVVYAGNPNKSEALHSLMYRLRKTLGARLGRRIKNKRAKGWIYVQPRLDKRPAQAETAARKN